MIDFNFWCYKVLPLLYDDSLSYYELLCKFVKYINDLIEQDKVFGDELKRMQEQLDVFQKFIDEFDTSFIEKLVKQYLATMIFVEITDAGYIVYNIPDGWDSITFHTTGLDIELPLQPDYGHLVLSY